MLKVGTITSIPNCDSAKPDKNNIGEIVQKEQAANKVNLFKLTNDTNGSGSTVSWSKGKYIHAIRFIKFIPIMCYSMLLFK